METNLPIREYFHDAKTKGKKEYNRYKARGESGHLTSLDGLIREIEIVGTVILGEQEIPLNKIIGTYCNARRMMFSRNFLPVESDNSEFSSKWMEVCRAHLQEGLRDPIKVYEYLNYFYVMEGNKRVSVLKYYDAASVRAEITRLIPKFDEGDEDIVNYYGFLSFYEKTKLNTIWLSKHYRYERLLAYLEGYKPEGIHESERFKHFNRYVYQPFRSIYKQAGGDDINMTTGDAFLLYIKLYRIEDAMDEVHLKAIMPSLLLELTNYGEHEALDIVTDAVEIEKTSLLGTLGAWLNQKPLRVGFVYARDTSASGWTYSHDLGRKYVETLFGEQIETGWIDKVPEDESAYEVIRDFTLDGNYDVVFTTSEVFRRQTLKCAIELTKVRFFSCSGNRPYVHMSNYFGRTYEPRFLTGVIAGTLTQTNLIGYTATDPNPEVISSINAFTLGAKLVNPKAEVLVSYTGEWNSPEKSTDICDKLINMGVDILSNKNIIVPRDVTWDYGVYAMLCDVDTITKKPKHYLAAPIWKWGNFYEKIISGLLNGSYQKMLTTSNRIINLWWGLDVGVLDLYMAESLIPKDTLKLVKHLRQMLISNQYHPFNGPVYDDQGDLRVEEGTVPTSEEIMGMDWFVEGVKIIS